MAALPFNYHADAFVSYLISEAASGDSDGASCFLGSAARILKTHPDVISAGTQAKLMSTAKYISDHQIFYGADVSISGSFEDHVDEIQKLSEHR